MNLKNLILRCYAAKERNGSCYAVCLDLNLFAQGNNINEVQLKMYDMIKEYTCEAFTVDKEYTNSLIPRKAPFSFFVRYYCVSMMSIVCPFKNIQLFKTLLPVVPK